tara:strand:- start:242 stop:877 length:636 start_codon:yes stop_codon:yes gene_type:complete
LTKNKIRNFAKDRIGLIVNDAISTIDLLELNIEEIKQEKKKDIFELFFNSSFELDENKKISIQGSLSKIEENTELLKSMLSKSSQLIMSSSTSIIKRLETDIYASLTNIVDRIEKIEAGNYLYAMTLICKEETDNLIIKENLQVKKHLDYYKLAKQQSQFQLFVNGMLQVNDTVDKGDYLLMRDENDNIVILFHELLPVKSTISIFAVKSR